MARTGRAYPSHPIVIHGRLTTGATPPSTPRSRPAFVTLATNQTVYRKQLLRFHVYTAHGIVPVSVVFVAPPRLYVFQSRNLRRRIEPMPPQIVGRAQADIIVRRQPTVVRPAPRRTGRYEYKPVILRLVGFLAPFVKPPRSVVVMAQRRRPLVDIFQRILRLPAAATAPVAQTAPVINGPTQQGQTLRLTSAGTYTGTGPIVLTYQWQRDDDGGGVFTDIPGFVATTYTTVAADVGSNIRVVETATNAAGAVSQNSNQIGPILAPPYPSFFIDTRGAGDPWDPDLPLTPMADKLRRRRNA